jgi:uncharacterized protein YfaQ (DUF2300 family)
LSESGLPYLSSISLIFHHAVRCHVIAAWPEVLQKHDISGRVHRVLDTASVRFTSTSVWKVLILSLLLSTVLLHIPKASIDEYPTTGVSRGPSPDGARN